MCLQNLDYSEVTIQSTLYKDTRPNLSVSCLLPGLSIPMEEKPSSISQSFHRVQALLAQTTHATSHRQANLCSAAAANPAAGAQAGKLAAQGLLCLICYFHTRQARGKNTKNHLGCLAFPTVRLCLVLFLNLPALTIQSGIFQAWCLLKVLEKVSQQFNCF